MKSQNVLYKRQSIYTKLFYRKCLNNFVIHCIVARKVKFLYMQFDNQKLYFNIRYYLSNYFTILVNTYV